MSRYNYDESTINISNQGSRNKVRKKVIDQFMKETPGSGNKHDASRYRYYVEKLSDGNRIYLDRPANLKAGFDFLIRVENIDFSEENKRRRNAPKHDDIINDLISKKEADLEMYKQLYILIKEIYNCNNIREQDYRTINFSVGFSVDLILGVLKWFFIEQDIRYWNYSGRNKLMSYIDEIT